MDDETPVILNTITVTNRLEPDGEPVLSVIISDDTSWFEAHGMLAAAQHSLAGIYEQRTAIESD